MKKIILIFAFSMSILLTCNAQTTETLHVRLDLTSPIESGWLYPSEETVGLRGDQLPLSWGSTIEATDDNNDGIYHLNLPFSFDGDSLIVSLKIKVDGVDNPDDGWQKGQNHTVVIHKNSQNNLTLDWDDQAAEPPSNITGTVEVFRDFPSTELDNRDLYIYLPPDYEQSEQRYPVLYMNDGQNLFDASITGQEWNADETTQQLILNGEIEPIIIVGIASTADRFEEYTPTRQEWKHVFHRIEPPLNSGLLESYTGTFATSNNDTIKFSAHNETLSTWIPGGTEWQNLIKKSDNLYFQPQAGIYFQFEETNESLVHTIVAYKPPAGGNGNAYGEFILTEVKPFIDKNLRTLDERTHTSLGGSSLGGLITMHLGLKHPDVFGNLLVVSPSVWWDNQWIITEVNNLSQPTSQRIWLDMGTAEGDQMINGSRALRNALIKKGWATDSELMYIEASKAPHNERAWAERFPDMLKYLYGKKK